MKTKNKVGSVEFRSHLSQRKKRSPLEEAQDPSADHLFGGHLPLALCFLVLACAVFLFTRGWLDQGLPGEDFPGNVAHVQELRRNLAQNGTFSQWSSTWFNGQPRTLLFAKLLSALIPLALSFLGPIASLKVALVFFHFLSGLAMFVLLGGMIRNRAIRTLGAVMYAVHPMALVETAQRGHLEVSLYYAVVPLVFWLAQRMFSRQRYTDSLLLGLMMAAGLWLNNEGSFVTYPFLLVFLFAAAAGEWKIDLGGGRLSWLALWPGIRKRGLCLALALATCIGLGAFFCLPVLFERGEYQLFKPDYVLQSIQDFSYRNPLYVLNRSGAILDKLQDLPPEMKLFGSTLYLGLSVLGLACLGLWAGQGRRAASNRAWFIMAWAAFALSFGGLTPLSGLRTLAMSPDFRSYAFDIIFFLFVGGLVLMLLWGRPILTSLFARRFGILLVVVLLLIGIAFPCFKLLRWLVPIYRTMRSPLWFFITPCVFATCVLATLGVSYLHGLLPRKLRDGALLVLLGVVIWDFMPYGQLFYTAQLPETVHFQLQDAGLRMASDNDWCRTLGAESYNPLADMLTVYSGKPSAWSWLNWSAPKGTGQLIFDHVYPQLCSSQLPAVRSAAVLAGLCNVKYVIDDLAETPNLSPEAQKYFKNVGVFGQFAVHENPEFRPYVQLYPTAVAYIGPFDAQAASVLSYCASMNAAFYEIAPENFSSTDWKRFEKVFWNLQGDEDGRPVGIPAQISPAQLVDIRKQQQFSIPLRTAPPLQMKWVRENPDTLRLSITNGSLIKSTLQLVVTESFMPNWRVKVNSKPGIMRRANHAFLATELEPGDSEIVFSYPRPFYCRLGDLISTLSLIAVGYGLFKHFKRKRLATAGADGVVAISRQPASSRACSSKDPQPSAKLFPSMDKAQTESRKTTGSTTKEASALAETSNTTRPGSLAWMWPDKEKLLTPALCLLVFLTGMILYVRTLAPTVTARDMGEFIAAAYSLGVPHPPGYPLLTLLGHFFCHLPVGTNIAWRANLLSACFGSLTCSALLVLFRTLGLRRRVAFLAALTFLATPTFWAQSVVIENYVINAFCNVLMLIFAVRYLQAKTHGYLYLAILMGGLSITCHYMSLLLLPPLVLFLILVDKKVIFSARVIALSALVFLLALSPMMLPWLFAQKHPPLNWGNPDTFVRWINHVRRIQYRALEFSEIVPFKDKLSFLLNYLKELNRQFSPLGILLLFVGLKYLKKSSPLFLFLILGCFLMNSVGLTLGLHFRFQPIHVMRVRVYYVPSYIFAWTAIVLGWTVSADRIGQWLGRRRHPRGFLWTPLLTSAPFVFAFAALLLFNWQGCDWSKYYFAEDYAKNIFRSMKKDSIAFPIGDHQTFPLAYYQVCEKLRPDILVGDLYGYLEQDVLREYHKSTGKSPRGLDRESIESGLIQYSKRPLYFFQNRRMAPYPGFALVPMGVCYEVMPEKDAQSSQTLQRQEALWREFTLRGVDDPQALRDEMGYSICSAYEFMRGEMYLSRGQLDQAIRAYEKAIERGGDNPEDISNIGSTLAERGYVKEAQEYFLRTLKLDPAHKNAHLNLATSYLQKNDVASALYHYRMALRYNPHDRDITERLKDLVQKIRLQVSTLGRAQTPRTSK